MIKVDENDPVGEVDPSFPYKDVYFRRGLDVKEIYDLQKEIGRGKFGTVYRCREKGTGLQLAAKFVATPRREDRRNVEREVDIMRVLQHPRLIQLYDAFDNGKIMVVILELIEGGELFERVIDDDFILTEKSCTVFMRQICEGIEFVHQKNILHLDLKPENILCLTKTGNRIKIIDFGLARHYDPQKKLQVLFGTPEFVAPEVVNFDQIGYGTDMWSIGVICYVLLSGLSPFMGDTDIETMANVTIAKYDFEDEVFNEISEDAKDFIRKLLLKDRGSRLSATQCLAHPWLKRKPIVKKAIDPEELDVSKDNLRLFVERWNEHPNSPYLFDKSSHSICYIPSLDEDDNVESIQSLRGFSPSPCCSLSTSSDSAMEDLEDLEKSQDYLHYTFEKPAPANKYHLERLHNLERRASDSSCVVKNTSDISSRVNLAEEIKKLSDRLFQMAAIHEPTKPTNNMHNASNTLTLTNTTASQIIKPIAEQSRVSFLQESFRRQANISVDDESQGAKRTKFKITNLNREVPLAPAININDPPSPCSSRNSSDTLPSTSLSSCSSSQSMPHSPCLSPDPQPSNNVTKDLFFKLLNKWDNKSCHPSFSERMKKANSVEWSEVDDLGQRTVTSLSNFYHSARTVEKKQSIVPPNFAA